MTETNAYGPQNGGADYIAHPTSTGRATPILEIEVRDPEGTALATGERGEIWFKGPHLIRGYWNKPDATAETIVDGWLRSGDIGRIDDEGLRLRRGPGQGHGAARRRERVLRRGRSRALRAPGVHEAAVFGVPHERLGEEVAAAVLPRAGATVTEELQAHVGERLASFKVPSLITIVDAPLPATPRARSSSASCAINSRRVVDLDKVVVVLRAGHPD